MSQYRPLVGLNDTDFDANLHKNEIDHDFFDNPSGEEATCSISNWTSNSVANKDLCEDLIENSNQFENEKSLIPTTELPNQVVKSTTENNCEDPWTAQNPEGTGHLTSEPFQLSLSTTTPRCDDLETPETCVSSPNMGFFALPNQQIFSTGKLLECLPHSEDVSSSGPHSSFFDQYFEKPEDVGNQQFRMSQNASAIQYNGDLQTNQGRLFDISSSSSSSDDSDSDSEISDLESLDTEDEEFVNLLEKYYDYIDLGESDYSDITEVSPMSSMTASPLPPFVGEDPNVDKESTEEQNLSEGVALLPTISRFPTSPSRQILKPKPLPPLIIHTMEEVSKENESSNTIFSETGYDETTGSLNISKNSITSSLLMKVEKEEIVKECKETKAEILEESNDASVLQSDRSSLASTPSRVSFGSATGSSSSRTGSSLTMSSSSSFSGSKRYAKNHSFTPDQMRRIERDNSILMKKIIDTGKTHHGHHGHHWSHTKSAIHHHRYGHHLVPKSSASITRQRQQKRIDHENSILIRRLQNVKPSKEIETAFRTSNNLKCT